MAVRQDCLRHCYPACGCSKPRTSPARPLRTTRHPRGASNTAAESGIGVGHIGGRSGKYYPVNRVWSAMGSTARQSAVATFSPYLPSTTPAPEDQAQRTTQPSAPSHPNTAPSPNAKSKTPGSRTQYCPNTFAAHLNCLNCFKFVARS